MILFFPLNTGRSLEECEWATEEFEQVLQEAFDFDDDEEEDDDSAGEFMSYSFSLLNQSDDEADAAEGGASLGYVYNEAEMYVRCWWSHVPVLCYY